MALNRLSTHSIALLSIFIAAAFVVPVVAQAQNTGDVQFNTSTAAIVGTVKTCTALLGCNTQNIIPANPVSVSATGSADHVAYNLNVRTTNGALVATIATSDNGATDVDSASNDSAVATEDEGFVSFLNGVVTYDAVQADEYCIATAPDNGVIPVTCTPQTTIINLEVNGQRVYTPGTQVALGTQVPLHNVTVMYDGLPYDFNGALTIGATTTTGSGTANATSTFAPIDLEGTLCLATDITCGLQTITVSMQDYVKSLGCSYVDERIELILDKSQNVGIY